MVKIINTQTSNVNNMRENNYFVDRRKYAVRFLFDNKSEASSFSLPKEYKEKFELNKNIDVEGSSIYVRIAQVKLVKK